MKKEEEKRLLKDEKKEKTKIKRQKSKVEKAKGKSEEVFNADELKDPKSILQNTKDNNTERSLEYTKNSKDDDNVEEKKDPEKNIKEESQVETASEMPRDAKKPDKVTPVKKKRLIFSFRRTKTKSTPTSSPARQKLNAKSPSIEESAM